MKRLLLLLIVPSIIFSQWKQVGNNLLPTNPGYGLSLQQGQSNNGIRLGNSTKTDSGWVRYHNGGLWYHNGLSWKQLGISSDTSITTDDILDSLLVHRNFINANRDSITKPVKYHTQGISTVVALQESLNARYWRGDTTYLLASKEYVAGHYAQKFHLHNQDQIDGLEDTVSALAGRINAKLNYADTTSLVANQWRLSGKLNISDTTAMMTNRRNQDTVSILASKSWVTNKATSDTATLSTIYKRKADSTASTGYASNYSVLRQSVDIDKSGYLNPNLAETSISFDGTNTFTLGSTTYSYYKGGYRYTVSGNKTVDLSGSPPATAGLYYIYTTATDGTLTASTVPWNLYDDGRIPTATVLWNNSLTPKYWLADERHTDLINRRDHYIEHFTEGCKLQQRATLSRYTVNLDQDTAKNYAISNSIMLDEDIIHYEDALAKPTGADYVIFYRATATTWAWTYSTMPFYLGANNKIHYDAIDSMKSCTFGVGANERFVNAYLLVTNIEGAARYAVIMGQSEYTTLALAQAESYSNFNYVGFPIAEAAFMYRVTYTTQTSTSKGLCKLAATPVALSSAPIATVGNASSLLHNSLTGLFGSTPYYHGSSAFGSIAYGDSAYWQSKIDLKANTSSLKQGAYLSDTTKFYLASNPSGYTSNTGTVTSVATGAGLTGGTITTTGTLVADTALLVTRWDTTASRTYSDALYSPKAGSTSLVTLGTITTGTVDTAYTNAVSKITGLTGITATKASKDYFLRADTTFLVTRWDTLSLSNRIDSKQASGTYIVPSDTTLLSNRINAKFNTADTTAFNSKSLTTAQLTYKLNHADTTGKWEPKGTHIFPSDTTLLSNRINAKFNTADTTAFNSKSLTTAQLAYKLNHADTTNKWSPKGTYIFPSDTTLLSNRINGKQASGTYLVPSDSTTMRTYSDAKYWIKANLDTANRWAPKGSYQASGSYVLTSDTSNRWSPKGSYVLTSDTSNRWAPKGSYQPSGSYVLTSDTSNRWSPKGSYVLTSDTSNRWAPKGSYQPSGSYVLTSDTSNRWAPKGSYQAPIANLGDTSKYFKRYDSASTAGWYRRAYIDALLNAKVNTSDTSNRWAAKANYVLAADTIQINAGAGIQIVRNGYIDTLKTDTTFLVTRWDTTASRAYSDAKYLPMRTFGTMANADSTHYGRLADANTWTAGQSFSAGLIVGNTIYRNIDNSSLTIGSGTSGIGGAYFELYGKTHPVAPGWVNITTGVTNFDGGVFNVYKSDFAGTNTKLLNLASDGSLTLGSQATVGTGALYAGRVSAGGSVSSAATGANYSVFSSTNGDCLIYSNRGSNTALGGFWMNGAGTASPTNLSYLIGLMLENDNAFGIKTYNGTSYSSTLFSINGSGNASFAGSVSAPRFTSTGLAGDWTAYFHGDGTTGNSYGLLVDGGTNSTDKAILVRSHAGTNLFYICGDGTATLTSTLTVQGTGNSSFAGNVLINTTSDDQTGAKLQVAGGVSITGSTKLHDASIDSAKVESDSLKFYVGGTGYPAFKPNKISGTYDTLTLGHSDSTAGTLRIYGGVYSTTYSVIDSSTKHNSGDELSLSSTLFLKYSMSFTGVQGTLSAIQLKMIRNGSPTGYVKIKLYAHSGVYGTSSRPIGNVLATSDSIDVTSIGASASYINFMFSPGYGTSASTYYCFVTEYSGGDGSNYIKVCGSQSSSASGDGASYNGASWAGYYDPYFIIYRLDSLASNKYANITTTPTTNRTITIPDASGTVQLAASSRRYKTNIDTLEVDPKGIYKLNPVSFDYIDKSYDGQRQVGLIAEEVYSIYPEVVGMKNGKPDYVKYDVLSVILLKEIQNMRLEIDELKRRIK